MSKKVKFKQLRKLSASGGALVQYDFTVEYDGAMIRETIRRPKMDEKNEYILEDGVPVTEQKTLDKIFRVSVPVELATPEKVEEVMRDHVREEIKKIEGVPTKTVADAPDIDAAKEHSLEPEPPNEEPSGEPDVVQV